MQAWPLNVTQIIEYAGRFHSEQQVHSLSDIPGEVIRSNYGEVKERAQLCALALRRLGVR
jgi:hypothetical protein